MGEWGIGQPVPRFEDPRLVRGEGNYVGDMTFPGTVPGYVLRSPHAHARIKSIDTSQGQGRSRRAGGAHRRGLGQLRLRRSAGAGGAEAPRRFAALPAALSGAGARPRALGRRLRRLRGGGDRAPGDGRGRADRGRLRAAAGGRLGRRGDQAGRAARLGRLPEQHHLRASGRRQGQDRRGLRQGRQDRQASFRDQPRDRRQHGAARLDRRLSPATTTTTPSTPRCSATSPSARSCASSCSRSRSTRCASCPATSAAPSG